MTPLTCVVDTNVAVVANRRDDEDAACIAACGHALERVMQGGHVFIDDAGAIIEEYRKNLEPFGEPHEGNAFLKWLLTNEWNRARVTRVKLTPKAGDPDDFEQLPQPPPGVRYDPSDRKFLAVAAAHADHPPILQALDSKWWGWREPLAKAGVSIHFVCPGEVEAKYREKMDA